MDVLRMVCFFLAVSSAFLLTADTVYLENGSSLEGKVQKLDDGSLRIKLQKGGTVVLSEEQVASVEYGETTMDTFKKKRAALPEDSASSHVILARWCEVHGFDKEAEKLYRKALEIDSGNQRAHKALGHVKDKDKDKDNDEWITREEYHRRRGEVYFEGGWVSPEEKNRLLRKKRVQERIGKMMRLIYKASRYKDNKKSRKFTEAMAGLEAYPEKVLEEFLIYCLDRQMDIMLFAVDEIVQRRIKKAAEKLVDMAVRGNSKKVRIAGFKALKALKAENTWYHFSRNLYTTTAVYRIYALQGLIEFNDVRSIKYILHSFPFLLADKSHGGLSTSVTSSYIRGYEVIPRNYGGRLTDLVRPVIGRTRRGVGLQSDTISSEEKKRRIETVLRYRALEALSGMSFPPELDVWRQWWKKEGAAAVKAFLNRRKQQEDAERKKENLPKAEPPPALMD